jgi:5-(carboxyamino)imidazole ribonucleotide mutase
MKHTPKVLIFMGSESDMPVMKKAQDILNDFGVSNETCICSAHRSPGYLYKLMQDFKKAKVFIAGAGMAAHLAGVVASLTERPVIGVPLSSGSLNGFDALLSTVQMPPGMPVATVAVDGSKNAAFLAIQMLALNDEDLKQKLTDFRVKTEQDIVKKNK